MLQGDGVWKLGVSLVLFWVIFGAGSAGAASIYVDDDAPNDPGPGDPMVSDPAESGSAVHPFDAIQEALDAADEGDSVLVQDGVYTGPGNKELDFDGRDIILRSLHGPKACTIDCEHDGVGFRFHSGETLAALVQGFTITRAYDSAGGIFCGQSSPTIRDCVFYDNVSWDHGGGIRLSSSNSWIINCVFRENSTVYAHGRGGGVSTYVGSPVLFNCAFVNNAAAGEYAAGGGIHCIGNGAIINCSFFGNTASAGTAGGLHCDYGATPTVKNCVLWDNYPLEVSTIGDPDITYSDVRGGFEGEGNLAEDPGFALVGDVHLVPGSPCIDAGTGEGSVPAYDLDGNPRPLDGDGVASAQSDMGAFEFNPGAVSIAVAPLSFAFAAPGGEGDPEPQTLEVRNCGGGTLEWSVVEECAWLSVVPPAGTSDGEIDAAQLVVEVAGLEPGDHFCTLSIEDAAAVNTPIHVEVELHVCDTLDVPAEYATIQDAIDAAVDCDTVVVADGVYTGARNKNLDFAGRLITVRSAHGPESCIIDCEYSGRGFKFQSGETAEAVVEGFSIIRGWSDGAGFHCSGGSSPTITRCIMRDNTPYEGGGIKCYDHCSPVITHCVFRDNVVDGSGGGIYLSDYCDATISHCTFTNNQATGYYGRGGGIHCYGSSNPRISNCVISHNSSVEFGGGIALEYNCNAIITNCTLRDNLVTGETAADPRGGGIYIGLADAEIANCIVWENSPDQVYNTNDQAQVTFCDVQGGFPGAGNLDADPAFALEGDAHLTPGSPCVDAGDNSPTGGLADTDLDGSPRLIDGDGDSAAVVDLGAYEFDPDVPCIAVAPGTLEFFAPTGGPGPDPKVLTVRNCGGGALDWEAGAGAAWITVWPASGTSTGESDAALVFVSVSGLSVGQYESSVTISAGEAPNSPVTITVVLHVYDTLEVPGEYATIQAALDAAEDYDVVLVADGTYTGDGNKQLTCRGKAVTVRSAGGPERCTIDCENSGNAFYFTQSEGRNTIVDGFTIVRGFADSGGAFYIDGDTGPTIRNCILRYNRARSYGGAVYSFSSRASIVNCVISENAVTQDGALGGGLYCYGTGSLVITNCTVVGNRCDGGGYGGGMYFGLSNARAMNCIVWDNEPSNVHTYSADPAITYSNIQGGFVGEGNLQADPAFALAQDYHLLAGSPCVDAGSTQTPVLLPAEDIDGAEREVDGNGDMYAHVDLGAYEFDPWRPRLGRSAPLIEILANEGGPNPEDAVLQVRNCGGGTLAWGVGGACAWLSVDPDSGSSTGESDPIALSANVVGLAAGVYSCLLEVSARDTVNSPVSVEVRLYVTATLEVPSEYGTLQAALDAASELDNIVVADGTYTGVGNRDLNFQGKKVTLRSANGAENCIIDCAQAGRAFVFASGEGRETAVEGFTIRGGLASTGGAVYCYSASKPTFSACVFEDNRGGRGGAIACGMDSHAALRGCVFRGNEADQEGGALYCKDCKPLVVDCSFVGNSAGEKGGAVWSYFGARPTFRRCAFHANSTEGDGGAVHNAYGADPRLVDCVISGNTAGGWGGGVYNDGSDPQIFNCIICGNTAGFGGGIGNLFGDVEATNCLIVGNVAETVGGGVYDEESSPKFVNCTISGNVGVGGAGALGSPDTRGAELGNCVIWGNGVTPLVGENLVEYCDVEFGWEGMGNVEADPRFGEAVRGVWTSEGLYDPIRGMTTFTDEAAYWVPGELVGRFVGPEAGAGRLVLVAENTENAVEVFGDYAALAPAGMPYTVVRFDLSVGSPCLDAGDSGKVTVDAGDVDEDGDRSERTPMDLAGRERFTDDPAVADSGSADPPEYPVVVDMGAYEGVGQRFVFESGEVDVPEGGGAVFSVWLARAPLGTLQVTVTWLEGDVDLEVGEVALSFDADNYHIRQDVSVAAVEDEDYLNGRAVIAVVGSDGTVGRITAVEQDNESVPAVLYVDIEAPGTEDGMSWPGAFGDLQDALNIARYAPGVDEIRVAEGIYRPASAGGVRAASFALVKGLSVLGGYAGYGESEPDLRAPEVFVTVLNGDLNEDDGPGFSHNTENSFHVVTGHGCDVWAVLDGVTVSGGNADGMQEAGHADGAGLHCVDGGARIMSCKFEQNWAAGKGGGGACSGGTLEFDGCTFVGNQAADGGGAYGGSDSELQFVACAFDTNSAGGAEGQGGALFGEDSTQVLTDCSFAGNSALVGGAVFVTGRGGVELNRCSFVENSADHGGGIACREAVNGAMAEGCSFYGNLAMESGGAVFVGDAYVGLTNAILSGNQAGEAGGGVWVYSADAIGAALELTNCSFSGNAALMGTSVASGSVAQSYPGELRLSNCILWESEAPIANLDNSYLSVTYSDVFGGWPGAGNLDLDPLYGRSAGGGRCGRDAR